MSGFLYAACGDQRPAAHDLLDAWGMRRLFTAGSLKLASIENRPVNSAFISGKQANLFLDPSRHEDRSIGYYPDTQTWRKLPAMAGRPEMWIGFWNDAPPKPADLLRADRLPARATVEMGGGLQWAIPQLCELDDDGKGPCLLPGREDFNNEGELFVAAPEGEDGELWDLIYPLALRMYGFAQPEPTIDDLRTGAIALLARNYAVGMPELAIMRALYKDSRYANAVTAATRADWLLRLLAESSDPEKKAAR